MNDHDALIETLAGSAGPVRRPLPPMLRGTAWLLVTLACGWFATAAIRRPFAVMNGGGGAWAWWELGATLAVGLGAILAAFQMSIPGRAVRGRPLLLAGVAGWIAISLFGLATSRWPWGHVGAGMYCFRFILVASVPMIATIVIALRRTRSLHPRRTLMMAGLGVGFLALAQLAFCHPFAFNLIDTLAHLAAVLCVVALAVLIGAPFVSARQP